MERQFIPRIIKFIERHNLIQPGEKIITTLSGGADSVALMLILRDLRLDIEAAHCNFHLRGEESKRDEEFVTNLCHANNIKLHTTHFDTYAYAARNAISIEMAARELRYNWFEKLRRDIGADKIAVAHHRDDSVETLLLNLCRGTGIDGLRGIRPISGHIIRPLLEVSRKDIEQYLKKSNQTYVTDSTNLENEFKRNKLRLDIIPMLKQLNPSVSRSIYETAQRLAGVAEIYHEAAERAALGISSEADGILKINISGLMNTTAPETILYEILSRHSFTPSTIDDIYHAATGQPGKIFYGGENTALIDREEIIVADKKKLEPQKPELERKIIENTDEFKIQPDRSILYADADKINGALSLRPWQEGDRFTPFGMKGSKLVSDYLTDRKYSMFAKAGQYVLLEGDNILWLVGERADERYRIDKHTKRILIVRKK